MVEPGFKPTFVWLHGLCFLPLWYLFIEYIKYASHILGNIAWIYCSICSKQHSLSENYILVGDLDKAALEVVINNYKKKNNVSVHRSKIEWYDSHDWTVTETVGGVISSESSKIRGIKPWENQKRARLWTALTLEVPCYG